MKKFALIFTLAIITALPSVAQIKLGVSLEPQISWFGTDRKAIKGDGSIGGVSFGLNVDRYFAKQYAFYTGVFIETTGGYLKYQNGTTIHSKDTPNFVVKPNGSVKYRTQYISIPTGIKLKTNPIGYNSFYAILGFKTSLRMRTKGFTNDGKNSSGINSMDGEVLKNQTEWANLGYQLGVGTEYSLGNSVSLLLGITYNNGITNTMDDESVHVNLNNLSLKLGVMF